MDHPIQFVNRVTGQIEVEKVYGDTWLRLGYETFIGAWLTRTILTKPFLSRWYGSLQDSPASASKISGFVEKFGIKMDEFENPGFKSFNEFFIRKFKPGVRTVELHPSRMAAPAEARYFAWEKVTLDQSFPVKGQFLTARALLGDHPAASRLEGGSLYIARLCPVDYHRFHFPDSGSVKESYRVHGAYHSVNPVALKAQGDILCTNERQVTLLETDHFGLLAYIEVGALCVGKIVQSHESLLGEAKSFQRGDEKGYFLFGGSTVIVLGEPGRWKPDADLLENTQKGLETWIPFGMGMGQASQA
jgi:phosphatidylserine decarboxylase